MKYFYVECYSSWGDFNYYVFAQTPEQVTEILINKDILVDDMKLHKIYDVSEVTEGSVLEASGTTNL